MLSCDSVNRCKIIAHRGFSDVAQENTLTSIDLAYSNHADAVEIDIRVTRDNIPIVYHDERLDRQVIDLPEELKNKKIEEFYYSELQNFSVGKSYDVKFRRERIPKLLDVLNRYKNRELILDIKKENKLKYIIEDILASNYDLSKLTLNVYTPGASKKLRRTNLGFKISLVNGNQYQNSDYDILTTKNLIAGNTNTLVYSLNTTEDYDKALLNNSYGIMTKNPKLLYEHLQKRFGYLL